MTSPQLSPMAQDYVKVVWSAGEWSDEPVTITQVAARMGVAASTASDNVRRLVDQGLLNHAKYGAITLTHKGTRHAVTMVRSHRIIETYLVERLGYDWDEVHDEAEVLEHACSARMIEAMDAALGHPERDPHGDPIPRADGTVPTPQATVMTAAQPGHWRVARISDADPALLRHVSEIGLTLDAACEVVEQGQFQDGVRVRIGEASGTVALSTAAASALWLVPDHAHA